MVRRRRHCARDNPVAALNGETRAVEMDASDDGTNGSEAAVMATHAHGGGSGAPS
jgi:hypothetical protein